MAYLSHEGMEFAAKEGLSDPKEAGFCGACFSGKYPLTIDEW